MKIGFTGTQRGMTGHQLLSVDWWLGYFNQFGDITEIHHGGCIGADQEFHSMCLGLGLPVPIVHPASDVDDSKRAYLAGKIVQFIVAKPALKRNHDIVDSVDILIATPAQNNEILRSGTWATIRYAKKVGRVIIRILEPDIGE